MTLGTLMELLHGVHVIDTYANTALLTDRRLVLVDTSADAVPNKLFEYLADLKIGPEDLTSIVITHTHGDHVSGLAAVQQHFPSARVACHEIEAPFISQQQRYPGPPRPATHKGVPVDVRLKDQQTFEGFTVFHTPGHTRGSMSLYDRERRLLIAGDAVRTEGGLAPMEDVYNVDPRQHRESIKRLATLDIDTLVCGHGPPIAHGAGAQLQALAARLG